MTDERNGALEVVERHGVRLAVAGPDLAVRDARDATDLIAAALYEAHAAGVVVRTESLPAAFFDLRTGFAGDVLQKFANYRLTLGVAGDVSMHRSRAWRDFVFECGQGRQVAFAPTVDEAVERLSRPR